ncbi:hypothetical protein DRO61_06175 [Candidatus Bathyarchaeota archaeon]|nr:MAG: hypothetical protein DRO61_06175 [Candidatus Bathyarchaeota archaeon]
MENDFSVLFAPILNKKYSLYKRKSDGSKFISMIEPDEWSYNKYKLIFLGYLKSSDGVTWEKNE